MKASAENAVSEIDLSRRVNERCRVRSAAAALQYAATPFYGLAF